MRPRFAIGLILLLPASAPAAEKPIPQDHARMEKRFLDRLEWNRRTLQGTYDKIGKKDPRWDAPAREALELAARMFAQQVDPVVALADVHVPARTAVDAGCDDPLILYLYGRTSIGRYYPKPQEYDRRLKAAATAMADSRYSPYRKAVALKYPSEVAGAKKDPSPAERREAERALDAILDLLPKSVAEDPRNDDWEQGWYAAINSVIEAHRRLGGNYKAAYDRVDAKLARVPDIRPLRLTIKGFFFYMWGWEARTEAFAPNVSEVQVRTFESRLRQARAALEEAWKLRPREPRVATIMLDIEKAIGEGDRAAMETWFARAMETDPNDEAACLSKLDWLDPKWHGDSPEEMVAFGRACKATGNWRTGITLLVGDAHLRYFHMLPADQRVAYMKSPEVWSDIQSVYDEFLKHYPDDAMRRSKYAFLCAIAGHIAEAQAQFQAVGDNLTTWRVFPNVPLEQLKQIREAVARVARGHPGAGRGAAPKAG